MFPNNQLTEALVAERQQTLRNEARSHRLGLRGRRSRGVRRPARLSWGLADLHNPPPAPSAVRERLFA